jgi:uncharacterized protein (DUF488 family)
MPRGCWSEAIYDRIHEDFRRRFFFSTVEGTGEKTGRCAPQHVSQLAGFAKRDDLRFFLKALCGIDYDERPELAPTQDILDDYRKRKSGWPNYSAKFLDLMARRKIEDIDHASLDGGCLLCSEDKPHHCHRRLVAEYLKGKWGDVEIEHL